MQDSHKIDFKGGCGADLGKALKTIAETILKACEGFKRTVFLAVNARKIRAEYYS